jgi:hypothetical protein
VYSVVRSAKKFCDELMVNDEKEEYVEVSHMWNKSHKCKFKNKKPCDLHDVAPCIHANPKDELCP